ncbi:MAG TPA: hypothetical protein VMJ12_06655 [Candidatus Acidoferrales bacterium]|nr:hypothetical protein [Candidatus Acidoferrales bacterium]
MNENQPNFESLRRLLALKRHETPPPGYFNNFSRQVIARIRAGESRAPASLADRVFEGMPWFLRLLQSLETKPIYAGGFATALCGLLVFGAVMAQRPEVVSQAILQPGSQVTSPLLASATSTTLAQPVNPMLIADNSTNPVVSFAPVVAGQMPFGAQFTAFPVSSGN